MNNDYVVSTIDAISEVARTADDGGRVVLRAESEPQQQVTGQPALKIRMNPSYAFIVPWLVGAGLLLMQWLILVGPSHRE